MKNIKVVLIEDVRKLGKKNNVVEVNPGFAKNFLFKNNLAIPYTNQSIDMLQKDSDEKKLQHHLRVEENLKLKEIIEKKPLIIFLKSYKGKVIGGVNPGFMVKEIKKQFNIDISKSFFSNKSSIADFGIFKREIKFSNDVISTLIIEILEELKNGK